MVNQIVFKIYPHVHIFEVYERERKKIRIPIVNISQLERRWCGPIKNIVVWSYK